MKCRLREGQGRGARSCRPFEEAGSRSASPSRTSAPAGRRRGSLFSPAAPVFCGPLLLLRAFRPTSTGGLENCCDAKTITNSFIRQLSCARAARSPSCGHSCIALPPAISFMPAKHATSEWLFSARTLKLFISRMRLLLRGCAPRDAHV